MAKRVLFVCVKNTSRSQMAEALLKMSLPAVEAYSAGTHPGEEVNPMAVAAMRELGCGIDEFRRVRDMLAERIGRLRRELGAPLAA